ncbi:MAG: 6,7-dimethyl-8-ribityllumazine synthase [Candidatus Melainabacteria bacterium RIFCSPLOWO2_02_FULL_35_15]|nr:MAG: 6,7-dimethyl-8-ribityllumazine synthase [Candidatus Melainabacteria bacterium RIFCSPLOWO2_12_FULL_35_11]OGI14234.1 MAG: 6,7-dimethyl-8-ribityllumazine synthase [Candidatus Melainabacteria bacterium RIFCSPLOWO2_02_FULL_35_15]
MLNIIEGNLKINESNKFAIVVSRFNEFITEKLLDGCIQTLANNGIEMKHVDIIKVPGTFEIPTMAGNLVDLEKYSAIICLGCVVRGETSHYDHICNAVSNEICRLGTESRIPVIFGILTCENIGQAMDRAGGSKGNKGSESALAAIEMVNLLKDIKIVCLS